MKAPIHRELQYLNHFDRATSETNQVAEQRYRRQTQGKIPTLQFQELDNDHDGQGLAQASFLKTCGYFIKRFSFFIAILSSSARPQV